MMVEEYTTEDFIEAMVEEAREEERKEWQVVVADKDAEIADKDAEIANQAAEIALLREQLAKLAAHS